MTYLNSILVILDPLRLIEESLYNGSIWPEFLFGYISSNLCLLMAFHWKRNGLSTISLFFLYLWNTVLTVFGSVNFSEYRRNILNIQINRQDPAHMAKNKDVDTGDSPEIGVATKLGPINVKENAWRCNKCRERGEKNFFCPINPLYWRFWPFKSDRNNVLRWLNIVQ